MDVDVLTREFESSEIKSRPGSYGSLVTYAPAKAYITRLNEAFGPEGWSFTISKIDRDDDEIIAVCTLTAGAASKTNVGSKRLVRNDAGEPFAIGDDTKAAVSLALKRCAQLFGIGLHLYEEDDADGRQNSSAGQRREQPTTQRTAGGITDRQIGLIRQLREEADMTQDDIRDIAEGVCKSREVENLNRSQASALIEAIKRHKDARKPDESQKQAASF